LKDDAEYKAIVQKVITEGPHGSYAVATSEELEGSVTFSLEQTVWHEEEYPEAGMYVLLGKLRQKRAGWRAKTGRFWKPSDEQRERSKNMLGELQEGDKFTLILTYGGVAGFPAGQYGNGRVIVKTVDREKFRDGNTPFHDFIMASEVFREMEDAYVYFGRFEYEDDLSVKAFKAMLSVALHFAKQDHSRVKIVGCDCKLFEKESFAEREGFEFIRATHCGGEQTLAEIIKKKLAEVPAEQQSILAPTLMEEFAIESPEKHSHYRFERFGAINDVLVAGRTDGHVFWKKDGEWLQSALKLEQGVNEVFADGDRFLIGDGSCCNGDIWALGLDGTVTKIVPVNGQGCGEDGSHLQGNVYGFARRANELIVGVGGCSGQHIYRLNSEGKWEYHPLDQNRYACICLTSKDGSVYLTLSNREGGYDICRYDGSSIATIAHVGRSVGVNGMVEWGDTIYVTNTERPSFGLATWSKGYIYAINKGKLTRSWTGAGDVSGFLVHNGNLYTYGTTEIDSVTTLLILTEGGWKKAASFDTRMEFFVHQGEIYAGTNRKIGEKGYAVIYKVVGL